jgi:hypothetical protein
LPLPQDPPPSDGPYGLDGFCWHEVVREGLEGKPFALVRCLWNVPERIATFEVVAKEVWGESDQWQLTQSNLGSARRKANAFFERWGFPFNVRTKNRQVQLIELPSLSPNKKARKSSRPARK